MTPQSPTPPPHFYHRNHWSYTETGTIQSIQVSPKACPISPRLDTGINHFIHLQQLKVPSRVRKFQRKDMWRGTHRRKSPLHPSLSTPHTSSLYTQHHNISTTVDIKLPFITMQSYFLRLRSGFLSVLIKLWSAK